MKLYEKIYLPERQEGARAFRDNQGDVPVVMHGPVIVLTREEAFDLWMAALDYCDSDIPPKSKKDFKIYLQSKGITL